MHLRKTHQRKKILIECTTQTNCLDLSLTLIIWTVCCQRNLTQDGLINSTTLQAIKSKAVLINVGRGNVVVKPN
ncbi:hypothetical protein FCL48_23045 [Desulforhopalus sp. IMCC35007]|nr:hypothetical protein FCL48_23045 [Desulforhopalus sp. IMCC35007]